MIENDVEDVMETTTELRETSYEIFDFSALLENKTRLMYIALGIVFFLFCTGMVSFSGFFLSIGKFVKTILDFLIDVLNLGDQQEHQLLESGDSM